MQTGGEANTELKPPARRKMAYIWECVGTVYEQNKAELTLYLVPMQSREHPDHNRTVSDMLCIQVRQLPHHQNTREVRVFEVGRVAYSNTSCKLESRENSTS
jgi:hypothetical protein